MNLENNHNDYDDDESYEEMMTELLNLDTRRNLDFIVPEIYTLHTKNSQLIKTASANYRKLFKEIGRLRSENEELKILYKEMKNKEMN